MIALPGSTLIYTDGLGGSRMDSGVWLYPLRRGVGFCIIGTQAIVMMGYCSEIPLDSF
jgi:hypothetical protein